MDFTAIWTDPASILTGTTVENLIRDVMDQLVAKDETENMSQTAESIHIQHEKIVRQAACSTPRQGSITINHQDTIVGQDNDHLHLTDSHFSQDEQECGNPSSFSHDTGPFPLSDAITSVDLTTWGPDVRRHNQGGRSMGSTDLTVVVTTRGGVARASQVWQDGGHRINMPGGKTVRNVSKDSRRRSAITGRRRRSYARTLCKKEEVARRMEEQKNRAFRSDPRRPRPRARVPTLEQMNDHLRNDQSTKLEPGVGSTSRAPTAAVSSSTNDHLEEVLKGQAQQAEFLQHMWEQQ